MAVLIASAFIIGAATSSFIAYGYGWRDRDALNLDKLILIGDYNADYVEGYLCRAEGGSVYDCYHRCSTRYDLRAVAACSEGAAGYMLDPRNFGR